MVSWLIPQTSSLLLIRLVATMGELLDRGVAGQGNIWKIQISPVLLQAPTTLLAPWYHLASELHVLSCISGRSLRLTRLSFASHGPKTANDAFRRRLLKGNDPHGPQQVQAGSGHATYNYPQMVLYQKKPCSETGSHRKIQFTTCGCVPEVKE